MDSITKEVLVAIRKIIRASDLHSSELLRRSGVTAPQLLLLEAAKSRPGATLGELSGIIHLSQATTTTILDRLEAEEMVARYRSQSDRRKVHVRLTRKGLEALAAAPMPMQSAFIEQFQQLKPHERSAILSSFQHVADLMQTDESRDLSEADEPALDKAS